MTTTTPAPPGLSPGRGFGTPAARHVASLARGAGLAALVAIPLGLLAIFFVYPVGSILALGLHDQSGWNLEAFARVAARSRFYRIGLFTIGQAAASAALSVLLGVPGAYLLYRKRFRGRAIARSLVIVPFVLPTVVVGLAFRTLFAESGWLSGLGWDTSVWAILAAHVFFNYSVVVRTVGATWAHLDTRPVEAARTLGAGPARAFMTVTLPALGPAIGAAAVMAFLFCASSFGVILVMGGGRWNTVETEIYRQSAQVGDLSTAAVLSIVQIVFVTAVLVLAGLLRRRTETALRLVPVADAARRIGRRDFPAVAVAVFVGICMTLPMATLVMRSLDTPSGWGLDNYRNLGTLGEGNLLLVSGTQALVNSVRSAIVAAALSVAVGTVVCVVLTRRPRARLARRSLSALDAVLMLPLGVSAVTVGFGFLVALDSPPFDFRSSAMLVPIAQAMVTTPLVVRMVLPVLRATDERLRYAAAILGAGPVRVWASVDFPLMTRALLGASAFAFAVGLGEFGATAFVARPETITLPVMIARLIGRPGAVNAGMAMAAAVILSGCCAAAVLVVDAAARARAGSDIVTGGF